MESEVTKWKAKYFELGFFLLKIFWPFVAVYGLYLNGPKKDFYKSALHKKNLYFSLKFLIGFVLACKAVFQPVLSQWISTPDPWYQIYYERVSGRLFGFVFVLSPFAIHFYYEMMDGIFEVRNLAVSVFLTCLTFIMATTPMIFEDGFGLIYSFFFICIEFGVVFLAKYYNSKKNI